MYKLCLEALPVALYLVTLECFDLKYQKGFVSGTFRGLVCVLWFGLKFKIQNPIPKMSRNPRNRYPRNPYNSWNCQKIFISFLQEIYIQYIISLFSFKKLINCHSD
jgi:hypothetical protein